MKKTLLAVTIFVVFVFIGILGCRGWTEMRNDVRQARAIHKVYRDNTTAKNPTETAKVETLGAKIDSILGHMEELSE